MTAVNREDWLNQAISLMRNRLFTEQGFSVPEKIRISVGFPRRSRGKGQHAIGQCWHQNNSGDGVNEIFIHPELQDPIRILDVTAHELVHTISFSAGESGHGKAFKQIATKIGLEGKMTATVAGAGLITTLGDYAKILGEYPHKSLLTIGSSGGKKQGTRMLKVMCTDCGYTIRITQTWIDVGLPTCPCGQEMVCPDSDGE